MSYLGDLVEAGTTWGAWVVDGKALSNLSSHLRGPRLTRRIDRQLRTDTW